MGRQKTFLLLHTDYSDYLHFAPVLRKFCYVPGASLSAFLIETHLIFPAILGEGKYNLGFTEEETEAEINPLGFEPRYFISPGLSQGLPSGSSNQACSLLHQDHCASYASAGTDLAPPFR